MSLLLIAGVHRPLTPAYIFSPPRPVSDFSFFFFFILTLINCGEIMFPSPYNGKPALHIVVLAVMNCPSGPFWSEFLMSTPEMESFRCVPGLESSHGEEFFRVQVASCCCLTVSNTSLSMSNNHDALGRLLINPPFPGSPSLAT